MRDGLYLPQHNLFTSPLVRKALGLFLATGLSFLVGVLLLLAGAKLRVLTLLRSLIDCMASAAWESLSIDLELVSHSVKERATGLTQ